MAKIFATVTYYMQQSWLLIVSAFIFGLLLAVTNAALDPRIQANKAEKISSLMNTLIDAEKFEQVAAGIEITTDRGKTAKADVYKALSADGSVSGFCFTASGAGFADRIELIIALNSDCSEILGYRVLASNETPGFGTKISEDFYRQQFIGAPAGVLELSKKGDPQMIDDEIIAISGATVSSTAVVNIFNSYTEQIKNKIKDFSDGR